MEYKKLNGRIVISDLTEFNINQILDCGQIFRYNISGTTAEVVSIDKYARIVTYDNKIEILSDDLEYFEHFFDLKNDYNQIKEKLSNDPFLLPSIQFGYGIRILNQDLFEMIVSFIISANNNIKRIKASLNYLSKKFGSKMYTKLNIGSMANCCLNSDVSSISEFDHVEQKLEYYAFPTLEQLKKASVEDYKKAGLGYRAEYMYDTIQRLTMQDLEAFTQFDLEERFKFLLSLKGIGEKVAHCILLFATHETSLFPVDTWINKVYNDLTGLDKSNRKEISVDLTSRYGDLSGYAQQYFYYYYRENKISTR